MSVVYTCVHACTGQGLISVSSEVSLHLNFFWDSLSQKTGTQCFGLNWLKNELQGPTCLFPVTEADYHVWLFTWVLQSWTKDLMLTLQALYLLRHLPSLSYLLIFWDEVSLCSFYLPGIYCIDKTGLRLLVIILPLSTEFRITCLHCHAQIQILTLYSESIYTRCSPPQANDLCLFWTLLMLGPITGPITL